MFHLLRDADVRTRGEEEEEGVVTLEVRESNRKAKSFYRKLGFEPVATRSSYYSNGEDATIMELQLLKPKTLN
jgi:ribosomal protein S18 acetylase RimI-like enzyme